MTTYIEKEWIETHNPVTGKTAPATTEGGSPSNAEGEEEEQYEENNMFESMFSDPDPFITTNHPFVLPSTAEIEIKLHGHKAELGEW